MSKLDVSLDFPHRAVAVFALALAACVGRTLPIDDPVVGTLVVTAASAVDPIAAYQSVRFHGVISAPGVEATAVIRSEYIDTSKHPRVGARLPVILSRSNPTRFNIRWDQVPSRAEQDRAFTEAWVATPTIPDVAEATLPAYLRNLRVALQFSGGGCPDRAHNARWDLGWVLVELDQGPDLVLDALCTTFRTTELGGMVRIIPSEESCEDAVLRQGEDVLARVPCDRSAVRCDATDEAEPVARCLDRFARYRRAEAVRILSVSEPLRVLAHRVSDGDSDGSTDD